MATATDSTTHPQNTTDAPGAPGPQKQGIVDKAKASFAAARERWPWLQHAITTQERYTDRRGNLHAANITFTGILSLVPIIMVAFAIGGFAIASSITRPPVSIT